MQRQRQQRVICHTTGSNMLGDCIMLLLYLPQLGPACDATLLLFQRLVLWTIDYDIFAILGKTNYTGSHRIHPCAFLSALQAIDQPTELCKFHPSIHCANSASSWLPLKLCRCLFWRLKLFRSQHCRCYPAESKSNLPNLTSLNVGISNLHPMLFAVLSLSSVDAARAL
jgi:hypothetical protein